MNLIKEAEMRCRYYNWFRPKQKCSKLLYFIVTFYF